MRRYVQIRAGGLAHLSRISHASHVQPPPALEPMTTIASHSTETVGISPSPNRAILSRARWATRAQFLNLGFVAGIWGAHIPSLKAHYQLDERTLALALLATSIGSLATLSFAGRLVGRFGARSVSAIAGATFCLGLGLSLLLPGYATLLMAMLVLGAGESVFDVAINAEGTTLETLSGRAVMSGFHGMFSLGAMLGAACAALMLRAAVPDWMQLTGAAACIATSIAISSRGMLAAHPVAATAQAHFTWPRGALLLVGILVCLGMLSEGVMYNWSVLYVSQELRAPREYAALAYVAFAGAMALMRFAGDAVRARISERTMLVAGPALAALAMIVLLLAEQTWVAMIGYAAIGVGLATAVPILYSAATRVPGVSPAAAIASVSSIGYMGFMIGPPIVGSIAHATSLTMAMGAMVVACVVMMLGAVRVPGR
jgi:MFS family permease